MRDLEILYVFADVPGEGNCSNWLCAFPATALDQAGYNVSMMHVSKFVEKRPTADIIVVERLLWNGAESVVFDGMPVGPAKDSIKHFAELRVIDTIKHCQDSGSKVIAIFDDHYEAYPEYDEFRNVHEKWIYGTINGVDMGFVPIDDFRSGLGMVDAVMTPSKMLHAHYGQYAKKIYYVHNRPDMSLWTVNEPYPGYKDRIVIGWSGTMQHIEGWEKSNALEALSRLKDRIVISGVIPSSIRALMIDAGLVVDSIPTVKIEMFPSVVASYDIGICPLGGEYDKGRSWIKWLECSLMGKPVIASDHGGVYDECLGGFLVKSVDDWYDALSHFIDDEYDREDSGSMGRAWAWQQGWSSNLDELLKVFKEVSHG